MIEILIETEIEEKGNELKESRHEKKKEKKLLQDVRSGSENEIELLRESKNLGVVIIHLSVQSFNSFILNDLIIL